MENLVNIVLRYAVYLAVGYALLVLIVFALQRSLLYHPDRTKPAETYLSSLGLRFWPQANGYQGLISATAPRNAKGTVIVFHGNAGSAWHRDYYVKALEPMGYRVILAEYPVYGGREGVLSEEHIVRDAIETITNARSEFQGPLFLVGESMGCGVAAAIAGDPAQAIAGLMLITPWDSLPALAQTHYWYLPAALLVKDRFDSVAQLVSYDGPVAVAMAEKDRVIPNQHTLALYEALTAPKNLWRFENAGHNDWPIHPSAPWWKEAMTFITTNHHAPAKR